ncbi:ATP-binding protein [Megalodesulfovibrio gigas]|uniref:histidine kinase n=1 Tax=Megalodesulfovibrio gigas (strain ATCC 19364 / DSM 1382 / NCIMB 9332 / VKM B-1759) TaxID=1121448 RepID=T2GBG1_MEGG1|nr:ATP-binding protein [Megalodesulfovibrio gigas]AGW13613.1 putative PAS/PAC sensor hybrid histidine kinase [Megalodesulfovibrio gigas DSM 1382 = ATCC 19364]
MLRSTRSRIVLLTALSALPALCIFLYSGWELRQQRIADATARVMLLAKGLAEIQQRHAESTRHLLETVAFMNVVRQGDGEACSQLFARLLASHPDYANILATTPQGDVFASGVPFENINLSDRKHFRDALTSKQFSAGEYIVSRTTGEPAFPFSLPILDDAGEVTAILIASFKLTVYRSYLQEAGASEDVIIGIVDYAGMRLFYHPPAPTNPPGQPVNSGVWRAMTGTQADDGVVRQVGSDGLDRFFSWKRLRLRPGGAPYIYCVAGMAANDVLAASAAITRRNLALWLLAALVGCGGAYLYGHAVVVRRLEAISRAAQALGQGDFAARTGLPPATDDVAQLATVFDTMAGQLQSHDADRTRAEESLRLSEQRFRRLLDEVQTVAVQGYTMEGAVLYWNRASELLYGYTAQEALGRNLLELIIPEPMHEEVRRGIRRMAVSDFVIPAGELYLRRKDGTLTPVFSSHVRLRVGEHVEMFCLDVDLSDLKRAEAAALKAKDAAEAANLAKSVFLANMSHEIRTPMNGVLGMLQLLQRSSLEAEQQLYVEKAILSSRRLTRLLADILDLSQVESGRMTLQHAPFHPRDLQEAVRELFATPAAEKGLALDMRTDAGLPELLVGDEVRLRQILFNLVNNAIKFTAEGSILVELIALSPTREAPVRMLITVCDTGIGIPPERLQELFSPFTQLDTSGTRPDHGAGLGLAIVRRVTELMRGHITVDTMPGEGTCMHVVVPLALPDGDASPAEPGRQDHTAAQPIDPRPATAHLHLLLAEDEATNRLVAERLLTQAGHEVVCAEHGQQVLDLLRSRHVDCVFMDIQMPVLDGIEATRRIRAGLAGEAVRNVPIIALTAHAMKGDRERFLQIGMNGYLEKPLAMELVQATLEQALRHARRMG